MKNVFSIIWKVIAVAMICVGVYLLVQVVGEADSVIEDYEQLTGNSIGATDSMKIVFLREYVNHTGNTDILFTLGITATEKELIVSDEQVFPGAKPEEDTQNPGEGEEENAQPQPSPQPPGPGANTGIAYVDPDDSAGHMSQDHTEFSKLKGSYGSTLSGAGCPIFALYNAYVSNCGGSPKRLEDIIMEWSEANGNPISINSNGWLQGSLGAVGEASPLWNYMVANYYNPGGYEFNNSSNDGSISVNDKITGDGKYIIYYSHLDGQIRVTKGSHSKCHWVYAERSGGKFTVYNDSGDGNLLGTKPIVKYFKLD